MMPGIYPRIVSKIFSQKAPARPTSKKTPSGGRRIAIIIFKISMVRFPLVKIIKFRNFKIELKKTNSKNRSTDCNE